MPNIKFTSLSAEGELLADDKIPFVDISDNAMGETGTNKIISASSLSNSVATLMSVNKLNGTKIVDGSLSSVKLSTGGPVWDSSGNFSIGTSSSSSTLITSIGKNRTSPGTSELHLFSTVSNTANATIVRGDTDNGNLTVSNTGTGNVILSQTGSGALIFSTAGSERVRIVPEGRVGIGKSNPATALDVVGTITAGSYSGDATLSGTPTAPTATAGTNTTRIATTEFVQTAISDSVKTSGAQTIAGIKTFSSTIVGSITGNSGTTDALKTAISAALTGDVTGTVSNITGSSNISIPTAIGAGVIDNSKVSTNAAIDGTKITPNFGNKNIVTTGTVTATAFSGPLNGNASTVTNGVYTNASNVLTGSLSFNNSGTNTIGNGTGDNATLSTYNLSIKSHWGIGFPSYDNVNRIVLDTRGGGAQFSGTVTAPTFSGTATKASTLSQGGGNGTAMTFNWTDGGAQPPWVWGGIDGANHYVYNPANFSVNYANSAGSAPTQYEEFRLWNNANPPDGSTAWGIAHNSPNWSSYQVFLKRVAASYVSSGYTQAMFSNIPIGTYIELLPDGDYYGRSYITTNRFYVTRTTSGNLTYLEPNINIFNSNSTGIINTPDTPQGAEITFANTDWQMVVRIYS